MKLPSFLARVPERVYLLGFIGILCVAAMATFFVYQDTRTLEKKILSKQKEVADIYALKDLYESKKQAIDAATPGGSAGKSMSLASIEEIAAKTLIGGRLVTLRPAAGRGDKYKRQMVVELKLSGAPLGEVVTFLRAIDSAGYRPKKCQLSLPGAGQTMLDLQASLIDARAHD
ncbi:MAG TPA: hypothetical protein DCR97_09515 [Deltaproteobacteria bacterium]|nr:hypothetical protein [Deltaproteobacteria bacterium]